jgi:uncharacterized membrane protein
MATVRQSVTVHAPVDQVFEYISDPTNLPEIWPSLVEVKDVQNKPGYVGSTYRWVYKMAGMRFEGQTECIECTPGERIVMQDQGGINAQRTTTFQTTNGETEVTTLAEYTIPVPLLGRLAEAFIVKQNEKEADAFLSNLKSRMEA